MNNRYKIIFDKIKEEKQENHLNCMEEIEEIRKLAEITTEINSVDQVQIFTTS